MATGLSRRRILFAIGTGATEERRWRWQRRPADASMSVFVALGHGDGTFAPATINNVPNHPRGIAIGDFNGDGVLDSGVAIFGPVKTFDGQVAVLIGHGDGSFAAPVFYGVGTQHAVRLIATDLNNDGKMDLTVALQHGARGTNGLGSRSAFFRTPARTVGTPTLRALFRGASVATACRSAFPRQFAGSLYV